MVKYTKIDVSYDDDDIFAALEDDSAFTLIGVLEDDLDPMINKFLQDDPDEDPEDIAKTGGLKDNIEVYFIRGKDMNKKYHLEGRNSYRDELGFLVVPREYFNDVDMVDRFRLAVHPVRLRWFDELIESHRRKQFKIVS